MTTAQEKVYEQLRRDTKTEIGLQRLVLPSGRVVYIRIYLELPEPCRN